MHFPEASSAAQTAATAASTQASQGRETILLVEDENAVRVIVSAVLQRQGYRVLEAATPRAACDLFHEHGNEIQLLVTDVVMPEMNGPTLAQRLVGLRPELRVLFISGYADVATPLDSDNPNVSFLSKPFQASTLSDRVRDMLSRAGRAMML
jgi:two-component system cell cycle sensor histidine kinase/response regulator CckA